MLDFVFTPWRKFCAFRDRKVTSDLMRQIAKDTEKTLRDGILNPPKTGRMYRRKKGLHQASRPGEFPANETGKLAQSVRSESTATSATAGTNMFYSKFLREGTRKMARRRMSDDALQIVVPRAMARLRGWVVWRPE